MPNHVPASAPALPIQEISRRRVLETVAQATLLAGAALSHCLEPVPSPQIGETESLSMEQFSAHEFAPLSDDELASVELPDDLSAHVAALHLGRELLGHSKAELVKMARRLGDDDFCAALQDFESARNFLERELEFMAAVCARLMIAGAAYGLAEDRS